MNRQYQYTVVGSAADNQTWMVKGEILCEFHEAFDKAMRDCFQQLTQGKAIFGKPGLGCNGPYEVSYFGVQQSMNPWRQ